MNYRTEVLKNCPRFEQTPLSEKLSLAGLGIAGEAGEVADQIKKMLHHDVKFTSEVRGKLIKEMGDVYWYLEYLGAVLDISTEDVQRANVEKLRKRHPDGWTPATQQAKADEE